MAKECQTGSKTGLYLTLRSTLNTQLLKDLYLILSIPVLQPLNFSFTQWVAERDWLTLLLKQQRLATC